MTEYVLGFLFKDFGSSVVLIRKNNPKWQEGLLNGIGGKIEMGETPDAAMLREFEEEAGVVTIWKQFCKMSGKEWSVHCFRAFDSDAFSKCQTMTKEEVSFYNTSGLVYENCVSNLIWLVELALDKNHGNPMFTEVRYE